MTRRGFRHARAIETAGLGGVFRAGERPPEVAFRLVRELAADGIPVAVACRVLNVSTSGYHEWPGRPASPREMRSEELMKLIAALHKEPRGTYGWPRAPASMVLGLG